MMISAPHRSVVKNSAPTHSGDCLGFAFGGGWRGLRFDRLFGISADSSADIVALAHDRPKSAWQVTHLDRLRRASVRRVDAMGNRYLHGPRTGPAGDAVRAGSRPAAGANGWRR